MIDGFNLINEQGSSGNTESYIATLELEDKYINLHNIYLDTHGVFFFTEDSLNMIVSNFYFNATRSTGGFDLVQSCSNLSTLVGEITFSNFTIFSSSRSELLQSGLVEFQGP